MVHVVIERPQEVGSYKSQKCLIFVNGHKVKDLNFGGVGGQKKPLSTYFVNDPICEHQKVSSFCKEVNFSEMNKNEF